MVLFRRTILFTLSAILTTTTLDAQSQWNQFRGPGGSGIAAEEKPLPVEFGPDTNLLWKCELASGVSSPILWEDRIYVTGAQENELLTCAIDRNSGEIVWQRSVECATKERMHEINSPAAPTPVTDGRRVYCYFGAFGLVCYESSGEEVWRRELKLLRNIFGTAASLILAEDFLIFNRDTNAASTLEAIDPETGETVWKTDRSGFDSGWSTPTLWRRDDVDELLVLGKWWLTAYDLADGSERWSIPGLTDEPIVTPTIGEGLVFVSSYNMNTNPEVIGLPQFEVMLKECDANGDGEIDREEAKTNVSILSRQDGDGEGDHPLAMFFRFLDEDRNGKITEPEWGTIFEWLGGFEHANALFAVRPGTEDKEAEIVWQHSKGVPECPSPLYYRGNLYLVKNGGMVSAFDAATGKVHYQGRLDSRGPHYASPVAGDGKIYSASARGQITVFEAGEELKVLARNNLDERIMATPALVDGKIYVRTEGNLFAFGLSD